MTEFTLWKQRDVSRNNVYHFGWSTWSEEDIIRHTIGLTVSCAGILIMSKCYGHGSV